MNEAEVLLTEPEGPEPMVVSGGVVSGGGAVLTVQVRVAGVASTLPAASVALTEKVCEPFRKTRVILRRSAAREGPAVQLALEGGVRLRRGEREGGG